MIPNDIRAEMCARREAGIDLMSGRTQYCRHAIVPAALAAILTVATGDLTFAQGPSVHQATLAEPNQKTQEVSTEDVRRILADGRHPSNLQNRPDRPVL